MSQSIVDFMHTVFGGDAPEQPLALGQIAARAVVVYIVGLLTIRIGKHRLISHATPLDVLFAFVLGSLLSRAITGSASLSGTTVASLSLVAVHNVLAALSYWSHAAGKVIKGDPILLVQDGKIVWDAMRKSLISEHDLAEAMRMNGKVDDIAKVRTATQERGGEISFVVKP